MKLLVIFFFISLNSFSFGQVRTIEDAKKFSETFVKSVLIHDEEAILQHIDKSYKKQQLGKFLKGNKHQFLCELFSGFEEKSEEWKNIDYKTITEMTVTSIGNEKSTDNWEVHFQIKTSQFTINSHILLITQKRGRKTKLGFVGAFG